MSAGSKSCGSCGRANTRDAVFCSACGARLPAAGAVPAPAPAVETAAAQPAPRKPAMEAPVQRRRVAGAAKTMLGGVQPKVAPAPAPEVRAEPPPAEAKPAASRRIAGSARTMLGVPAPDPALVAQAKAAAQAKVEPAQPSAAAISEPAPVSREAPSSPPSGAPSSRPPPALGATNRTMLGQPAPKVPASEPPPKPEPKREPEPRPEPAPEPARTSSVPPGSRGRAPVIYPANTGEEDALTLPKKRSNGPLIAVLALGLLVLFAGGAALAVRLFASGPDLRATVVQGDDGEMIELEVPGAAAGTRVRFHGSEQPLEAGRVRFPLRAQELSIGDNELSVDVIAPDGTVETQSVELHLAMRVRADLGALASVPPAVDVVVEAPRGSEVALDGEALELDSAGRATRRFPLPASGASAEGMLEHVVRYRVSPPEGESAQGELRTRIPITSLQIDRPGANVVTEAASVEVAGAVAEGTTVSVGGEAVEVRVGHFLTRHALAAPGEHTIEVVARAPGKAPRIEQIRVRRVASLEAEAASFEADRTLTYARIAQNPATYRGQRVSFEGVVYNVEVSNGASVVQMLVDGCPAGERCPLWVTYAAATDAGNGSRVRVLGTVAGEQQFRSQQGAIRTVPRVDATFLLPATADGGRRR